MPRRDAGRPKEIETPDWKNISVLLPQEIWHALRKLAFDEETKQAAVIRDLLEKHLEKKGLLRVKVRKDEEDRDVRSYETTF